MTGRELLEIVSLPDAHECMIDAVLEWWKKHEFDTFSDGYGSEYNAYNDEPKFVSLAKAFREYQRQSTNLAVIP